MFPLRQRTARASIQRRSLVNVPKNPGETKKETYRYTNIRRAGKQRRFAHDVTGGRYSVPFCFGFSCFFSSGNVYEWSTLKLMLHIVGRQTR